jgi:hypothetical protein
VGVLAAHGFSCCSCMVAAALRLPEGKQA